MLRRLLLFALLASACHDLDDAFHCSDDVVCVDPVGVQGRCEPTGYCSFVDASCASAWRYGEFAGDALGDTCVPASELCVASACPEGAFFCDLFESPGFDAWNQPCWGAELACSPKIDASRLEIVTSPACRGSSLLVSIDGTASGADDHSRRVAHLVLTDTALSGASNPLHVRMFLYVPKGAHEDTGGRSFFFLDGNGGRLRLSLGDAIGNLALIPPDPTPAEEAIAGIAEEEWACVELTIGLSTTATTVEVHVNEALVHTYQGPTVAPPLHLMGLGFVSSESDSVMLLYFDDFAMSASPIGCR